VDAEQSRAKGYDPIYAAFDSPWMQQIRREAYGEDIGQHSWVNADELRSDIDRLRLTTSCRLLDLGCGPGGPLVFAVRSTGCAGTGVEMSASALASGSARACAAGLQERIELFEADLNLRLPFEHRSFDVVISLDVVLHLLDRRALFDEVARVLAPHGKFLFTDAGVISGAVSNEEIGWRSANGYTQFVPPDFNQELLEAAGFRLILTEDRTASVVLNASGRLRARNAHRAAIEELEGKVSFARQQRYLEMAVELSERRALSRVMYLAELAAV
jgi:SAM-dependent methyltransferase